MDRWFCCVMGARESVANMAHSVPLLRETIVLPGCGHWTQQEAPLR